MKPTHKVTIGNEVFLAVFSKSSMSKNFYSIKDMPFSEKELAALNAKVEEIVPFRFEQSVYWLGEEGSDWARVHINNPELIGKRGKLIFQEEV